MIWAIIQQINEGQSTLVTSTQPRTGWTAFNVPAAHWLVQSGGSIVQLTEQQASAVLLELQRQEVPPLTAAQFFRGLQSVGLLATVTAAVDASGDSDLKLLFNRASVYQRADSRLNAMATQLGISQEQLDTYWHEWGQLE